MTEETTNNLALNTLSNPGTVQKRKRVGRGIGSGTGKTAAFALPILHTLQNAESKRRRVRVLVLVPTRELASQVGESFRDYGSY